MSHLPAVAAFALVASVPTLAEAPPAERYHGRLGETTVQVPKIDAPITIDGVADEAGWTGAALLTGFSQYAPVDGLPAADSTEVLVTYSDQAIYFAVRAYEPHGEVRATLADRDRIDADDHVQIMLDTFNDRRRAFVFAVNPFGVQTDGTFADGPGADLNPDYIFHSRGRLTAWGYEVEIEIPFKSLPFRETAVQDWGLNVLRRVQHSGHEQTWTAAERGRPSLLAQSGVLEGLTELRRGLVLDVNPVMTARATGGPGSAADPGWRYAADRPEFGGTVRWGMTPNLSLNATVNPDFSQVEADVGQVVTDPRRALSFPEKRPFFLEGSENFQVPNALVYSRRIVAPEAAAKLTGKVGGMNVGVLSAIDDAGDAPDGDHPLVNVVRLRRDLGTQSNVGLVYTERTVGSDWNRVVGADTRLLFGSRYVLDAQLASSFTRAPETSARARPLFDLSLTRTGRESGFNVTLEGIHPDFVAGAGFIPRHGIAHASLTPRRTFFPENSVVESVSFSPILDGTWTWDRFVEGTEPDDIKLNSSTRVVLRGGWRTHVYTWAESFKYPPHLYAAYHVERPAAGGGADTVAWRPDDRLANFGALVSVTTPQWQELSGSVEVIAGRDVNYDEWSSAWISFVSLDAEWRPTGRLRIGARHVEQRFYRRSDGSRVRLRAIPRLKVEYQLARSLFLRVVGQYDALHVDELRDDGRTDAPILVRRADGTFAPAAEIRRDGFRADWLFSYQPNPGTVVFVGYGTSLDADAFLRPGALERTEDGFFVKLSYLFRM